MFFGEMWSNASLIRLPPRTAPFMSVTLTARVWWFNAFSVFFSIDNFRVLADGDAWGQLLYFSLMSLRVHLKVGFLPMLRQ